MPLELLVSSIFKIWVEEGCISPKKIFHVSYKASSWERSTRHVTAIIAQVANVFNKLRSTLSAVLFAVVVEPVGLT